MTKEEASLNDAAEFELYLNQPERAVCPRARQSPLLHDRVVAALGEIGAAHAPGTAVAAVTHGVMVRLAVLRVAGPTEHDWQFAMPTASAVVFDVTDGQISLAEPIDRSDPDPRKSGTYLFQSTRLAAVS